MSLRSYLCFALSRPAITRPVPAPSAYSDDYPEWRSESLIKSWSRFSDTDINGRDVLDFGCGSGPLALYLASKKAPRFISGVDLYPQDIDRANASLVKMPADVRARAEFKVGSEDGLPYGDAQFDTLLAFDCMEHVMAPEAILAEWRRVLRPGGKVLIEWYTFKGPWGPHMNALIPIPWAHIIFGQRAMFETAARLYDDPDYQPRHWDLDSNGAKLPNKWKQWTNFAEQGYLNELTMPRFRRMAKAQGFAITRADQHGLGGQNGPIAAIGRGLTHIPVIGEYLTSHVIVELTAGG
jgi:SAM-dependent methyltransferase